MSRAAWPAMSMLLAALSGCRGCHGGESESTCNGAACESRVWPRRDDATLYGALADEGYGAALAWRDGVLWVGAPFDPGGGRLYEEEALSRTGGAFLGTALVATDDRVLVGADGRVEDTSGAVLLEETGVGGVLAASGSRWATRAPGGAVEDVGTGELRDIPLVGRPDSLAYGTVGGALQLGSGFAFGDTALAASSTLDLSATSVGRAGLDEAGWALLPLDVDGDGDDEWIVGAPGANRVDVRDGKTLELVTSWAGGTGRFGASLATDGTNVYVGAPMAGTDAQGAVWRCDPPTGVCVLTESGQNLQDQLGFAMTWGGANLYVGAPGGPGTAGSVLVR